MLVAVASACSSSAEVAEPTPTTVATTIATTTTVAPTTNTAPTTTASPWTDDELAVIQAYDRYSDAAVAAFVDPEPDYQSVLDATTPSYGQAFVGEISSFRETAAAVGTLEHAPVSVRFDGPDLAQITFCVRDQLVVAGSDTASTDAAPEIRTSQLRLIEGRWLVDGDGEPVPSSTCEL